MSVESYNPIISSRSFLTEKTGLEQVTVFHREKSSANEEKILIADKSLLNEEAAPSKPLRSDQKREVPRTHNPTGSKKRLKIREKMKELDDSEVSEIEKPRKKPASLARTKAERNLPSRKIPKPAPLVKKKILVLSNSGGGGHKTAAEALKRSLGSKYEMEIDHTYDQILGSNSFNFLMQKDAFRLLGLLTKAQGITESVVVPTTIKPVLGKKILEYKPDLIISVFPVGNHHTWELAKAAGIPMLVLATDLYCQHFFNEMDHPGEDFKIGLPFDDAWIKKQIEGQFDKSNFVVTGYPLRPDFGLNEQQMTPTKQLIQKELGLKDQDTIVLIMMGSQGGASIPEISQSLADNPEQYPQDLHVIALCSDNEEIRKKTLASCQHPINPRVKVHALDKKESNYIATLMKMATVLISKPGGSTVNEAIASELYTLYDGRANEALFWEKGNMEFAESHNWGEFINPNKLIEQVNQALKKPKIKVEHCPGRQFDQNILQVIEEIFRTDSQKPRKYDELEKLLAESDLKLSAAEKGADFLGDFLETMKEPKNRMDKLMVSGMKREMNEAIDNIKGNDNFINDVIDIVEKDTFTIKDTLDIFFTANELMEKTAKTLFPTENKTPARKVENYMIQKMMASEGSSIVMKYPKQCFMAAADIIGKELNSKNKHN